MKKETKTILRASFVQMVSEIDPHFSADPVFANHPNLFAVRRCVKAPQWQFVALTFSPSSQRFFVEVAIAQTETYPIDHFPMSPNDPLENGSIRFRASQLWGNIQSGGWLIQKSGGKLPVDSLLLPEGIFNTPQTAMGDVKDRMTKWILPYLQTFGTLRTAS